MAQALRTERRLDLVEATVLFRRLLGFTLTSFGVVALREAVKAHLETPAQLVSGIAVGLVVFAAAVLNAITAAKLATLLALPDPWRYCFGALLPCPNLLVVGAFGAHMLPAWTSVGDSPLVLLASRRGIAARHWRVSVTPTPSAFGLVATWAMLMVCLAAMAGVIEVMRALEATGKPAGRLAEVSADTIAFRPFAARGQAAFEKATMLIAGSATDTGAYGNTPEAVAAAQRVGEAVQRECLSALPAHPDLRPVVQARTSFPTYVHARPERAAVLVQVTGLDALADSTRDVILQRAWTATVAKMRALHLVGARRMALGLRGTVSYGAVTWGDLANDVARQTTVGSPADTTPVAAFFADGRIPRPMPTPSPGTAAARLVEQRARSPLRSTDEWRSYATRPAGSSNDEARQRGRAIRDYLTREDVEDLVRLYETEDAAPPEREMAAFVLGDLATGHDARIMPQQEHRLGIALRRDCLAQQPDEPLRCAHEVQRLWAMLDRSFLEETFQNRLAAGRVDQSLWYLLVETRRVADRALWSQTLEKLARAESQRGLGTSNSIYYWLEVDPSSAERAVVDEFSPRAVPPQARSWLAHALLCVAVRQEHPDRAAQRLAEIRALGGRAGELATLAREILGLESPRRIDALAEAWRERQSSETLSRFYYAYLEKLPVGTPFGIWLERLGKGGAVANHSLHVIPREGSPVLYIETDDLGRLTAMSFD